MVDSSNKEKQLDSTIVKDDTKMKEESQKEENHKKVDTEKSVPNNEHDDEKKDGEAPGSKKKNDDEDDEEAKRKQEELKKKYENWPMKDIKVPHQNDVLYGRGGGTNHHPGNKKYRKMVEERKLDYVNSKRLDKPLVALEIIRQWREQIPTGRFLKFDEKTGLWHDVGDKKAREKTSQALREKAPLIRKQQQEGEDDEQGDGNGATKTTRFAEGTSTQKKDAALKKAVLARDHSLGREYIKPGEEVSLANFSWEEPMEQIGDTTVGSSSQKSDTSSPPLQPPPPPPPPPPHHHEQYPRMGSYSSMGGPPPPMPPPPPPHHDDYRRGSGYYSQDGRQYSYSHTRDESWGAMSTGSFGYGGPPPPPPPPMPSSGQQYSSYGDYDRSGSYTMPPYSAIDSHQREHSLSGNALRNASESFQIPPDCFDSQRTLPNYPGSPTNYPGSPTNYPPGPPGPPGPPPPPPPGPYLSNDGNPPVFARTPSRDHGSPRRNKSSPPYSVDPEVAKNWSTNYEKVASEIEKPSTSSTTTTTTASSSGSNRSTGMYYNRGGESSMSTEPNSYSDLARPDPVKRATSNQNETLETKPDLRGPSIKRAALNRDQSATSNRLKQKYIPGALEIRSLSTSTQRMNLSCTQEETSESTNNSFVPPKPTSLSKAQRTSTIDKIAMDLMAEKPAPKRLTSRSSTLDALNLDLDGDELLNSNSREFLDEFASAPATDVAPLDLSRGASVSDFLND